MTSRVDEFSTSIGLFANDEFESYPLGSQSASVYKNEHYFRFPVAYTGHSDLGWKALKSLFRVQTLDCRIK